MRGANLSRAYLDGANLSDADLRGANLTDAFLSGNRGVANVSGADLRDAKGLTQEQLDQACGDKNTKLDPPLTIKPCPK